MLAELLLVWVCKLSLYPDIYMYMYTILQYQPIWVLWRIPTTLILQKQPTWFYAGSVLFPKVLAQCGILHYRKSVEKAFQTFQRKHVEQEGFRWQLYCTCAYFSFVFCCALKWEHYQCCIFPLTNMNVILVNFLPPNLATTQFTIHIHHFSKWLINYIPVSICLLKLLPKHYLSTWIPDWNCH